MKLLFKNWRRYLKESSQTINTKEEIVSHIKKNPDQSINIDFKKGSKKGFGGADKIIPFDYGEWPNLINPADGMGWDIIIVPSANKDSKNLAPIGHIDYNAEMRPEKAGNDKIIVAPGSNYSQKDKEIIDNYFSSIKWFKKVIWYKKEDKENGDD